MNQRGDKLKLIERKLTAALKELDKCEAPAPSAFLFLEWEEDEYDIPSEICGLPVFRHPRLINSFAYHEGYATRIPWVPLWVVDNTYIPQEYLENFNYVYENTE